MKELDSQVINLWHAHIETNSYGICTRATEQERKVTKTKERLKYLSTSHFHSFDFTILLNSAHELALSLLLAHIFAPFHFRPTDEETKD